MPSLRSFDGVEVAGKRVLLRVDFNVPVENGKVSDRTRIERALPTIRDLAARGGKVILLSHFGRPKGRQPKDSLKPLVPVVAEELGRPVAFGEDCVGAQARAAVNAMRPGDVLCLENTRFHAGEERNDPEFVAELADLGDIFVNDAFSVSHRAHASVEGLAHRLPAYAGHDLNEEVEALGRVLENPARPLTAIAFKDARQRLGQKFVQPRAQDVDQYPLADGFGLDRLVRPPVLVAAVVLDDDRQVVLLDLLSGQCQPFPPQRAARFAFKNAPGVVLDLVAREIEIAEIDDAVSWSKQRSDVGA